MPLDTGVEIHNDTMDHWEVIVTGVIEDATQIVRGENPYSDPPESGNQFYMITVRAKYIGPDSTTFDGSYRLRALGDSGVVYSTFENSCGVIPESLPNPELFTNGTVEGNECWQINSDDADSLMMFLEPSFLASSGSRTWFSLTGPRTPVEKYAAIVCARYESLSDDSTAGEIVVALQERLKSREAMTPPEELRTYHEEALQLLERLGELYGDMDPNAVPGILDVVTPEFLSVYAAGDAIGQQLPLEIRMIMERHGCGYDRMEQIGAG